MVVFLEGMECFVLGGYHIIVVALEYVELGFFMRATNRSVRLSSKQSLLSSRVEPSVEIFHNSCIQFWTQLFAGFLDAFPGYSLVVFKSYM